MRRRTMTKRTAVAELQTLPEKIAKSNYRFDMDGKNLFYWVEEKLKVLNNIPLDQNSTAQYTLLSQVGEHIAQLKVNIQAQNNLDDAHPICEQLNKAFAEVSLMRAQQYPTLHACHQLLSELENMAEAMVASKQEQPLRELLQQLKEVMQQENVDAKQKFSAMMQLIIETHDKAKTRANKPFSLAFFQPSVPDKQLGEGLEKVINQHQPRHKI